MTTSRPPRHAAIVATGLACLLFAAPGLPSARFAPSSGDDQVPVLERLHAYVDRFARDIRFLIARERYEQEVRTPAGSFGATAGRVTSSRTTDAEVAFANIADGVWMMTRTVDGLDGRPVEPLGGPPLSEARTEREVVERLRGMANDAAKWNIGRTWRNINTPTLALWFMSQPTVRRFELRITGHGDVAGAGRCAVVAFRETDSPPIMNADGVATPATGRLWVQESSGAVVKTELLLEARRAGAPTGSRPISRATIGVAYSYSPQVQFWVPATMTERYEQPMDRDAEVIVTRARYSDYRQFTVGVRIR